MDHETQSSQEDAVQSRPAGSRPGSRPSWNEQRFPLDPIARHLGITFGQMGGHQPGQFPSGVYALAEVLDRGPTWVYKVRRNGLTWRQADRAACQIGLHPGNLWPEWWDIDLDQVDELEDLPAPVRLPGFDVGAKPQDTVPAALGEPGIGEVVVPAPVEADTRVRREAEEFRHFARVEEIGWFSHVRHAS